MRKYVYLAGAILGILKEKRKAIGGFEKDL